MTFLEEVRELSLKGIEKKKEDEARAVAEYQKIVDGLANVIDVEIERCRDRIRKNSALGKLATYLFFSECERPDIVAQEVAKKFRADGFRVSSPYYHRSLFTDSYSIEVSIVW